MNNNERLAAVRSWTTSMDIHDNGDDTVSVRLMLGNRAPYCNSFMTMHLAIGGMYIWIRKYVKNECSFIEQERGIR